VPIKCTLTINIHYGCIGRNIKRITDWKIANYKQMTIDFVSEEVIETIKMGSAVLKIKPKRNKIN
jgi:hypothetical protein